MIAPARATTGSGLAGLLLVAALAACGDSGPPTDPDTPGRSPVSSVAVTPRTGELEIGSELEFEATVRDSTAVILSDRSVRWSSSDPTVATVDSTGRATGLAPGLSRIIATSEGVSDTALLTVVHAPVTLVGAGDIADCLTPWDEETALLLDAIPGTVFTLGDNAYEDGTAAEFADCYDPSWGSHKDRTYPAAGNHEYHTDGAAPYFAYFGARAGDPAKGYYSYEAGAWKVLVLNSNAGRVGVEAGSEQEQWLRAELAASDHTCTLAYWHHPRFSDGSYGDDDRFDAFWQALYEYGADLVLVGHDHNYQRFGRLDPSGALDPSGGIRQIVVGTGGRFLYEVATPRAEVEAYNSDAYGVLELTLRHDSYEWEFVPVAGQAFTDSGSEACSR